MKQEDMSFSLTLNGFLALTTTPSRYISYLFYTKICPTFHTTGPKAERELGRRKNTPLTFPEFKYSISRLCYGLDDRGAIPGRRRKTIFVIVTPYRPTLGGGVHLAFRPMVPGSFPGDKAVGAWNWPLTS